MCGQLTTPSGLSEFEQRDGLLLAKFFAEQTKVSTCARLEFCKLYISAIELQCLHYQTRLSVGYHSDNDANDDVDDDDVDDDDVDDMDDDKNDVVDDVDDVDDANVRRKKAQIKLKNSNVCIL